MKRYKLADDVRYVNGECMRKIAPWTEYVTKRQTSNVSSLKIGRQTSENERRMNIRHNGRM